MKLLFDQNISFRVIRYLLDIFPEIKHVKEFDLDSASDRQIWDFAKENQFAIVTFDSDFFDLATLYGHPPKVIWLRLRNTSTKNLAEVLWAHYEVINEFIEDNNYSEIGCLEIGQ